MRSFGFHATAAGEVCALARISTRRPLRALRGVLGKETAHNSHGMLTQRRKAAECYKQESTSSSPERAKGNSPVA